VKILPLILVAFGFMQTFAAASTNNPTVYISTRTDGVAGTGTAADPFNGSTQPRFDALMKSIAPNTTIELSAGTFLTNGADEYLLKSGWTINGSGMGVTIIKLAGHVDTAMTKHFHFWGNSLTNLEISNITFDGNAQGYHWPAHQAIGGVFINGCTNGLIDHVEMINCYGDWTDQLEQFSITLSGLPDGSMGTNLVIQNCVTHDYAPGANYTNGCMCGHAINPQIINCHDDGSSHAFGVVDTNGARIAGCTTTINSDAGFYTDTNSNTNLTIENNTFKVTRIPIQFNAAAPNSEDNVKILDNILESANPSGSGDAAIVLSGSSGNNFEIRGNTYIYTGPQGDGLILNNQENFTDLDVEDNSANVGLTGGGGGHGVTDTTSGLSGNHFNESVAAVQDEEQSSPANNVAATTGSLAPANFGSSSSSGVASTPAPATTPTSPAPSTSSTTTDIDPSPAEQASQPVASGATSSVASSQSLSAQAVTRVLKMNPGLARTTMLREVLSHWVRQNPPAAAQFAQTMTDGPDKQTAMQLVADQWEAVDPTAAMNWLTSLPQDMEAQNLYTAMAEKWASEDHPQPAE
jgi:hypothetical protein